MIIKVTNNRFIVPPLRSEFYQQLFGTVTNLRELATRLIQQAEHAYSFRKFEQAREIGQILSNYPLKDFHLIGHYYLGWYEVMKGGNPKQILEQVAEYAPTQYRVRALRSLAALAARNQDYESELGWLVESLKVAPSVEALRGVAIVKAKEDYHRAAVKDLEKLLPLARFSEPLVYTSCLNSCAVELGEVGRKEEARNISKIVLASPLVIAYPEWRETARELKEPNRSFISVPHSMPKIERKHVEIEPEPLPEPEQEQRPADVLPFTRPKEAPPPPKPERIPEDMLDRMTVDQTSQLVMSLVQSKTLSSYSYKKMLASVGMVKRGVSAKEIELDDLAFMADLISDWCNLIDPRLFIGVISALRDCDDRVRRTNIMDNMISEAIRQTDDSIESEDESRRKYERRLPKNDP